MKKIIFLFLLVTLSACSVSPTDLPVAQNFNIDRYVGVWYEIARLPNRFEKDLHKVTAAYSLNVDGGLKVVNRGFNIKTKQWEEADGNAYFTGDNSVGALKVSFFGPFYGGYNVIALDHKDYQYALIAGPKREYLWILARKPNLDKAISESLVQQAKAYGFPVEKLEWINHN